MDFNQLKYQAENGNVKAKYDYGIALIEGKYNGNSCIKNVKLGLDYLKEIADEGYTEAIITYVESLKRYLDEKKIFSEEPLTYLENACIKNPSDQIIQALYGVFLINYNKIDEGLKALTKYDNPIANCHLASYYLNIPIVIVGDFEKNLDLSKGEYYLQKALNENFPMAYYIYGCCYLLGRFGKEDHNKAYYNFYIAAANGYELAQVKLKKFKKKFLKGWVYEV